MNGPCRVEHSPPAVERQSVPVTAEDIPLVPVFLGAFSASFLTRLLSLISRDAGDQTIDHHSGTFLRQKYTSARTW